MKLNTRLWILILPVMVFSAVLVTYAVYSLERESLLRSEKARLKQYAIQLESVVGSYNSFAETYFEPLLKSASLREVLSSEDEFMLAYSVENNLTDMLKGLTTVKMDKFTLCGFL